MDKEKFDQLKNKVGQNVPRKRDPAGIEKRRDLVWRMFLEGVPQTAMSQILSVSRVTISSDLDYLKSIRQKDIKSLKTDPNQVDTELGTINARLLALFEMAFQEASAAVTPQDKDRFINTALRAESSRAKILIESGYLPKAGIEIKATVQNTSSFASKYGKDNKLNVMDDPNSRRKILAAFDVARSLVMKTDELKTIDVTPNNPQT